jgi:hypothetical protein
MESNFVKVMCIIIIILLTILVAFNIRDVEKGTTNDGRLLSKSTKVGEEYDKKTLKDKEKEKLFNELEEKNILNAMIAIKKDSNPIFSDEEMVNLLTFLDTNSFEKDEEGKYQITEEKLQDLSKKYFNRGINISKIADKIEDEYVIIDEINLDNAEFKYDGINNISSSDYELIVLQGEQKYSLCFSLRNGEMVYISFEKI